MENKNRSVIEDRDLDNIHKNLNYAKHKTNNPRINQGIGEIQKQILSLIKEIDKMVTSNTQKSKSTTIKPHQNTSNTIQKTQSNINNPKKQSQPNVSTSKKKKQPLQNKKIHFAHTGRNTHRPSSQFNPQGGFKPLGSTYHIKDYNDY
jgi:hypothetical protein